GPKDTLAPVLVQAVPKDSARRFQGNKIVFTFNEYVELQNIQENLLVSPVAKINPVVESKLKTVTVKIKDTLEPNTTYSINFGSAIKDINEGNVIKNFTYVFSTGNRIDSMELSGRVILAQTGKADSTLMVMLHRNSDDSAVIKERPRYMARLDSSGRFHFRNLAPGTYYIYALKDEGGQHRYLSSTQLFAFADAPVNLGDSAVRPIVLYAYLEEDKDKDKKGGKGAGGARTGAPGAGGQRPVAPGRGNQRGNKQDRRLQFHSSLENGLQDLLVDHMSLTFNDSLRRFDSSKALLLDEKFNPVKGYHIKADSTGKVYTWYVPWKENTVYNLVLDKEFAEDTSGRKLLKTDTIPFKTMKDADYGSFRVRFRNLDLSQKPVLLLLSGEEIKFSQKVTGNEVFVRLFKPGDYELRILYDTNGNGVWDTGEFFGKHRQPERVQTVMGRKKFTVKANWDTDYPIEF
ncbi:MAG: Ig-like domain-containing protein, partial [Bacteroidetes bacterium]|nr:Ig-like domain-containing protein [Bacteroidota bacterium]